MKRIGVAAWLVVMAAASGSVRAESQVVVGKMRLTVVTPNVVRVEYSPSGTWVEDRSMFAVGRQVRFDGATVTREGDGVEVSTPAMNVRMKADGNSPSAENLRITLTGGGEWCPGLKNTENLGGTIRTVDQVRGPVDLGQGVLSRSGWALVDDSKTPLLGPDGWVKERPQEPGATDWYVFGYGKDFRAALKALTAIGGNVPMPRRYTLGAWYSRYWAYSADDFKKIVEEYKAHDFPLDVIVMDMDWHITQLPDRKQKGQVWTGYTWDKALIPDPKELLTWFHDQGLAVTLNDHPADGVQPHEEMYESFMTKMGATEAAAEKKTLPFDAADKRYLDTFWDETHVRRQKEGVDFWWLDWQQYPNTRSMPSVSNLAWLNQYYFEQSKRGGDLRGVSFSRWAGWGDHRHPIHFSGDAATNWEMLGFEVPLTSTAGNVGCFFWSHDIGGHMGGRNEESYTRWCQFGAMSAALRSHSTRSAEMDRRPWSYPAWAEDSMRKSFHLRSELFPYIYSAVAQACQESVPLTRPMYFEYPDEEAAYHQHQQYMLGDSLLVAPIATPGSGPGRVATQVVWFPPGVWYDWFSGEKIEAGKGGEERVVAAPIDSFPLYVKAGAPIVMQPYSPRMATNTSASIVVKAWPAEGTQDAMLYEDDGVTEGYEKGASVKTKVTVRRAGQITTVEMSGHQPAYAGEKPERDYAVVLAGLKKPVRATVDGAEVASAYDESRQEVTVRCGSRPVMSPPKVEVTADLAENGVLGKLAHEKLLAAAGDDLKAKLAAGGVGLMYSTDSSTGYGGLRKIKFHANPGVLDDDTFKWSFQGNSGEQTVKAGGFEIPTDKGHDNTMEFVSTARIEAKVGGQPVVLEQRMPVEGVLDDPRNVARKAKVTASSVENGYRVSGAIDGVPSGYPLDKRAEWSSNHEKAGAWLRLTWPEAQKISSVALFDRPNLADQVTKATLRFSDGSSMPVGELENSGRDPTVVKFEPKTVTWVEVRIDAVREETENAGLAEIAVFTP